MRKKTSRCLHLSTPVIIILFISIFWLAGCAGVQEMPLIRTSTITKPSSLILPSETKAAVTIEPTITETRLATITETPGRSFQLCSPLAEHEFQDLPDILSSPYEPPPMGKDDRHQGVDFAYFNHGGRESIEGEGVQAILRGRVVSVIDNRLPYGNMIIIETPLEDLPPDLIQKIGIEEGESLYHLYAHLIEKPTLIAGDWVACGEGLGRVGATGYNVPVAHLHLETRIGPSGTRFEGMVFYDTRATEAEMENYKTWRMSGLFRHFDPMVIFFVY